MIINKHIYKYIWIISIINIDGHQKTGMTISHGMGWDPTKSRGLRPHRKQLDAVKSAGQLTTEQLGCTFKYSGPIQKN